MKDQFATTFHRDGTVSIWSVYRQAWARMQPEWISDGTLSTLSEKDRERIARLIARRAA
jgi:hypothetical protein